MGRNINHPCKARRAEPCPWRLITRSVLALYCVFASIAAPVFAQSEPDSRIDPPSFDAPLLQPLDAPDRMRAILEGLPSGKYQRQIIGELVYEGLPFDNTKIYGRYDQISEAGQANFAGFAWRDRGRQPALVILRGKETPQLFRMTAPSSTPQNLTKGTERISFALARPNIQQILYGRDVDGDENYQFYLYDETLNRSLLVTLPGTRNQDAIWSPDGNQLAWAQVRANEPDYELVLLQTANGTTRKTILADHGAIAPLAFSPDGRFLLVGQYISITRSERFVLEIATGKLTPILPNANASFVGGEFNGNGRQIILATDIGSEFLRLVQYSLQTNRMEPLADFGADVENFKISPDRRKLAIVINRNGASEISTLSLRSKRKTRIAGPELPAGVISDLAFSIDSNQLGFTFSSSLTPSEVFSYDLRTKILTPWTQTDWADIDRSQFAKAEFFTFPTFDQNPATGAQRRISAWLYRPFPDQRASGVQVGPEHSVKRPVIISLHGGPEAQARPRFNSQAQYWLAELGAVVIEPNYRGSLGFGKTFLGLDDQTKREDAVKDIGALLDWIQTQSDLDASRVLVVGGSYGGYLALSSVAHYSGRIAGGISMVGIGNFTNFLENTKGYRRELRRAEYGDERDPAIRKIFEQISPINLTDQITAPLFILQGLNDPRVPASEAAALVKKLRLGQRDVWFLFAENEGHGFVERGNNQFRRAAELMFIRNVLDLQAPSPAPAHQPPSDADEVSPETSRQG